MEIKSNSKKMKKYTIHNFNFIYIILLFLSLSSCSVTRNLKQRTEYTSTEIKHLKKCNTAKLAWYMGPSSKKIILLTNLLRTNPTLFKKYLHLQTDSIYIGKMSFYKKVEKRMTSKIPSNTQVIKPSFNLALASKIHSIQSGLNGQTGHQNLTLRMRITLNTNNLYGENCYYGKTDAYGAIVGWIESDGHYQNLIDRGYYRIGVSGFWHRGYDKNYVQVFSGKKWMDYIGL
jgi:hypothetical protein